MTTIDQLVTDLARGLLVYGLPRLLGWLDKKLRRKRARKRMNSGREWGWPKRRDRKKFWGRRVQVSIGSGFCLC